MNIIRYFKRNGFRYALNVLYQYKIQLLLDLLSLKSYKILLSLNVTQTLIIMEELFMII